MKYIISLLKFLGSSTLIVIGAYQWFTHEIKQVARAEVNNVKTEILAVRQADLGHIDTRFKEMRDFQDERFDKIEQLIKNK